MKATVHIVRIGSLDRGSGTDGMRLQSIAGFCSKCFYVMVDCKPRTWIDPTESLSNQ